MPAFLSANTSHSTSNRTNHCEPLKRQLVLQLQRYLCVCVCVCVFYSCSAPFPGSSPCCGDDCEQINSICSESANCDRFLPHLSSHQHRADKDREWRERERDTARNETPFTNLFIYIRRIYFITRSKCSRAESAATGKKKERRKEKEAERAAKRCCMKRPN